MPLKVFVLTRYFPRVVPIRSTRKFWLCSISVESTRTKKTAFSDTYLLRELSEKDDFFVRVHSTEMLNNQNFIDDLMGTTLRKYLVNTNQFNGTTKKPKH